MKRIILIISLLFAFLTTYASATEKDILKALENIKGNVESGVTFKRYSELLADAKVEINIYKRQKNKNKTFLEAAEKCLSAYELAQSSWDFALDHKRRGMHDLARTRENLMQDFWKKGAKELENVYNALNNK